MSVCGTGSVRRLHAGSSALRVLGEPPLCAERCAGGAASAAAHGNTLPCVLRSEAFGEAVCSEAGFMEILRWALV